MSSGLSWAYTDLGSAMDRSSKNAALYVDRYWSAIQALASNGIQVPTEITINKLLSEHGVHLRIEPPDLRLASDIVVTAGANGAPRELPDRALTLHEMLGRGGFGAVHRAVRTTNMGEFECAVKLFNPSTFVDDPEKALKRFGREIRVLTRLQHRAIVPYIDAGLTWDKRPYIVMPLIEGTRLTEAGLAGDHVRLCEVFIEILGGLAYLHQEKVLHRDLKPSNILIRATDGQAIILDFGCAHLVDDSVEASLTTGHVGSAGYIPSEVLANPKLRTEGQDIFACGIMLYEVLASHRPDVAAYKPLTDFDASLGPFDDIVREAIAPAERRFQTALAFRERLVPVMLTMKSATARSIVISPALNDPPADGAMLIKAVQNQSRDRTRLAKQLMKRLAGAIDEHAKMLHGDASDEAFMIALSALEPLSVEFASIAGEVALQDDESVAAALYDGLEPVLEGYNLPHGVGGYYSEGWFALHQFFGHELLVTLIATLMREGRWPLITSILDRPIYVRNAPNHSSPTMVAFEYASERIELLEKIRRQRFDLRMPSVQAEVLRERHTGGALATVMPFEEFQAADYFMFLRSVLPSDQAPDYPGWVPPSVTYVRTIPRFLIEAISQARATDLLVPLHVASIGVLRARLRDRNPLLNVVWSGGQYRFPAFNFDLIGSR